MDKSSVGDITVKVNIGGWLGTVTTGLIKLSHDAVADGMPEEAAVRIFGEVLDSATAEFLKSGIMHVS